MPSGKCVFNAEWLLDDDNRLWLAQVKDDRHSAFCKVCLRKFSIASMGKAALKFHKNGASHKKRIKDPEQTLPTIVNMDLPSPNTSSSAPTMSNLSIAPSGSASSSNDNGSGSFSGSSASMPASNDTICFVCR